MLVNLDPGRKIETLLESEVLKGHRITKESGSAVIRHIPPRSIGTSALSTLYLPAEYGDDAAVTVAINNGDHVEGVLYRLLAFLMELHLEVHPPSSHIRAGNAAACYWNLKKLERDGDTLSVQSVHGLKNWTEVPDYGSGGSVPVVVYTGPSTRRLGMALLTRLCASGGPVQGMRSPLLHSYQPLNVLMCGHASLSLEFSTLPHADWEAAIDQAIFILRAYNGVSIEMVNRTWYTIVHNLPLVNFSVLAEQDLTSCAWLPSDHKYGAVDMLASEEASYDTFLTNDECWQTLVKRQGSTTLAGNLRNMLSFNFPAHIAGAPDTGEGLRAMKPERLRGSQFAWLAAVSAPVPATIQKEHPQIRVADDLYHKYIEGSRPGLVLTGQELGEIAPSMAGYSYYYVVVHMPYEVDMSPTPLPHGYDICPDAVLQRMSIHLGLKGDACVPSTFGLPAQRRGSAVLEPVIPEGREGQFWIPITPM